MRLAIDVREACKPQRAGKAQWTFGFVSELLQRKLPVTLVTDAALPHEWKGAAIECIDASGFRWHWAAARWVRTSGAVDLYVSPTSYLVPWVLGHSFPHCSVVHDLIAFRHEPHDRKATLIERLTLPRVVRATRHLFTVSDATKADLCARYPHLDPSRATPIYAGPMVAFPGRHRSDGRTILCIATLCPRKNQRRLIEAFASLPMELRARHRLVLVGARGWHDDDILRLAASTPNVEWQSYVEDDEYRRLLSECHVFALPSLYEGFGMQILDCLQRGIPVLTSDRGSLREVVQDSACIVDPESVSSIAEGLNRLLTDTAYRTSLARSGPARARAYSWQRTVNIFLEKISALERDKPMVS